ncbi:MAG TPA: protein-L-isoaspartate O-methyltransferase [Xanthobacteraceae bacterium]|nr:protein-L-isoaspartate O-methyltransferase [Xanthobacteraceae bacterium]
MPDFAAMRRAMIDGQVRTGNVTDLRVIAAMLDLPRERFVSPDKAELAYVDLDLSVGGSGRPARWLLKPMVLARLLQAAQVREGDRVLDIGAATGYSSAVLGRLAGSVVALEEDPDLAQAAKRTLAELGLGNVTVVNGPLRVGWPKGGPYDLILLEGATEIVPHHLQAQLKEGGRLLCVLRRGAAGRAMLYRVQAGELSGWPVFDAMAPVLPGFEQVPEFVF